MTTAIQQYLQRPEMFQQVVQSAMAGDRSVLPEVRAILNEAPAWRDEIGSLVKQTENALMAKLIYDREGYTVLSNEHDGLVIVSNQPLRFGLIDEAREKSEFYFYSHLESKEF